MAVPVGIMLGRVSRWVFGHIGYRDGEPLTVSLRRGVPLPVFVRVLGAVSIPDFLIPY